VAFRKIRLPTCYVSCICHAVDSIYSYTIEQAQLRGCVSLAASAALSDGRSAASRCADVQSSILTPRARRAARRGRSIHPIYGFDYAVRYRYIPSLSPLIGYMIISTVEAYRGGNLRTTAAERAESGTGVSRPQKCGLTGGEKMRDRSNAHPMLMQMASRKTSKVRLVGGRVDFSWQLFRAP
jgi:hypothetical protein